MVHVYPLGCPRKNFLIGFGVLYLRLDISVPNHIQKRVCIKCNQNKDTFILNIKTYLWVKRWWSNQAINKVSQNPKRKFFLGHPVLVTTCDVTQLCRSKFSFFCLCVQTAAKLCISCNILIWPTGRGFKNVQLNLIKRSKPAAVFGLQICLH